MRSVIVTARTREEAIEKALRELGVERHEVHVEILEEGSKGFFGLGAKDVKIRVIAEHLPDEEPKTIPETSREASSVSPRAPRSRDRSRQSGGRRRHRDARDRKPSVSPVASLPEKAARNDAEPERIDEAAVDANTETIESGERVKTQLSPIECDRARALLEELIRLMGIQGTVQANPLDNGDLQLIVESEDSSILIGRKGKTLQALQYLINRMARSAENSEAPDRVLLDIAGYIDRRKAALEDMAKRLARRAKETGKNIRLKPMSPQERRIIHVTLQDDPDVRTFSVGEASSRCVVIAPREERPAARRQGGGRNRGRGRRPHNGRSQHRQPRDRSRQPIGETSAPASNEVAYEDAQSET